MNPIAPMTAGVSPRMLFAASIDEAFDLVARASGDDVDGAAASRLAHDASTLLQIARSTASWGARSDGTPGIARTVDAGLATAAQDAVDGAELLHRGSIELGRERLGLALDTLEPITEDIAEGSVRTPMDAAVPIDIALGSVLARIDASADDARRLLSAGVLERATSEVAAPAAGATTTPMTTAAGAPVAEAVDAAGGGIVESTRATDDIDGYVTELVARSTAADVPPLAIDHSVLERVLSGLANPAKSGVLIVGPPGVGKTTYVRASAGHIADERLRRQSQLPGAIVPSELVDSDILQIDLAGMIAGTRYRGDLADRLKLLERRAVDDGSVLFFDEAHAALGKQGDSGGPEMDLGNLIKTVTGDQGMKVVMTTTPKEMAKLTADGGALVQRFEVVHVGPPTPEAAKAAMSARIPQFEEQAGLWIDPPNHPSVAASLAARGEELSIVGAMPRAGLSIIGAATSRAAHRRDRAIAELATRDLDRAQVAQEFVARNREHITVMHQLASPDTATPEVRARATELARELERMHAQLGPDAPSVRVTARDLDEAVREAIGSSRFTATTLSPAQLDRAAVVIAREPGVRSAVEEFLNIRNKGAKFETQRQREQVKIAIRSYVADPDFLRSLPTTATEVRDSGDLVAQHVRSEIIAYLKEAKDLTHLHHPH